MSEQNLSSRYPRRRPRLKVIGQAAAVAGSIILAGAASPAAAQTITAPKESPDGLRTHLKQNMDPAGRVMPADATKLDAMLQGGDVARLTTRLRSAVTANQINLDLNWEQASLFKGAGFIVAYAYMYDLWRLGVALPTAQGDGLKQSASMMLLYSFDLIAVDGLQCSDVSAPSHRRDQLFAQNRAIAQYINALPQSSKVQIATISLDIEAATSPVRARDVVLCSGGLTEISEGLKAQGANPLPQVPNAPGTFGKTYAVPRAPGYAPKFVDDASWRPRQEAVRQALPSILTRLLALPTDEASAAPAN